MPNAECRMPNGQWTIDNGQLTMDNGQFFIPSGAAHRPFPTVGCGCGRQVAAPTVGGGCGRQVAAPTEGGGTAHRPVPAVLIGGAVGMQGAIPSPGGALVAQNGRLPGAIAPLKTGGCPKGRRVRNAGGYFGFYEVFRLVDVLDFCPNSSSDLATLGHLPPGGRRWVR